MTNQKRFVSTQFCPNSVSLNLNRNQLKSLMNTEVCLPDDPKTIVSEVSFLEIIISYLRAEDDD